MKFNSSFFALLLSTVVASKSLSFFGNDQKVLDSNLGVPGKSPLRYCQAKHDSDLLIIDHVNLDPEIPVAGATLTIEAVGTFLEDVEEGAYVDLQVKYGLIRLVNTRASLCEQITNIDLKCPIKKGITTITKDVEIPKEIPSGEYTVVADAYTVAGEKLTCLTATVKFSK
jgi:hypothetical protein